MTTSRADREHAFSEFYAGHFPDLLVYARRRTDQSSDAVDVVAETFLVAWRRFGDVPNGAEGRLWLFGVARKVLANHRRGARRRHHLGDRLREREDCRVIDDHADAVARRAAILTAMRTLTESDQEVLAFSAWEQLEPREIAVVLGVSAGVVRTRLNRARTRLRKALGDVPDLVGHAPGEASTLSEETR